MTSSTTSRPRTSRDDRGGAGGQRRRRAFTLLELLIALALLLALAALVLPAVSTALDERAFETAGDVMTEQLLLARAAASQSGRAVEVIYLPSSRLVRARWFEAGRRAIDEAEHRSAVRRPNGAQSSALDLEYAAEEPAGLPEPWAERPLAGEVRLSATSPITMPLEWPDEEAGAAPTSIEDGAWPEPPTGWPGDPEADEPIRIAVYLPDGSTLIGRPVWLVDDAGRTSRLEINSFTGLPTLGTRAPRPPLGAPASRPPAAGSEGAP